MDINNSILCHGCLCIGRKLKLINNFNVKQCFFVIINEMPMAEETIQICWECEANILRFNKFRKQVRNCYRKLQDCIKQNNDVTNLECPTQLRISNLSNITIDPTNNYDIPIEIIKKEPDENEPDATNIVKHEDDNISIYSDNSDDTALIDLKVKKKKKEKRKRKKVKEEIFTEYKEVELNRQEIEEERRLLMSNEDYVNAMFRCERCVVTFPNVEDLNDHVAKKHDLNANYKCSICECRFNTEISYNYHTNRHIKRYQCSICHERFTSKRGATKHYEVMHCHRVQIDYGGEDAMCEKEKKDKENGNKELPSFPCEQCDKTFRWKTSLRKHSETHRIEKGQKRKPYCEPCRLSFTTTSNLQKHVKTSSKHQIQLKLRKLTETLPQDEKHQDRIEQLKRSIMKSRQLYKCEQCNKRFQWRGNLLRHMHSHKARANGELVCEPCNRTFSSIATYTQHMKISKKHVTENDYKYMCSDCGKRFANKTRLKDHVDWEHLKNYVHTCDVCQKVFKSHTSLYLHKQVVHKKDNAEHLCDHCGKAFPNHSKLRNHIIALHSAQSPFKCLSCPARFSWHSCLSRHVRRVHRPRNE